MLWLCSCPVVALVRLAFRARVMVEKEDVNP